MLLFCVILSADETNGVSEIEVEGSRSVSF